MTATTLLFIVTEDYYFLSHRLHLARHAQKLGYRVALAARDNGHGESIQQQGIDFYPWALVRGSLNPLRELHALWHLRDILRRCRPQIIHAVAAKPILYASRLSPKNCAQIYALGGLGMPFSSHSLLARSLRLVLVQGIQHALRNPNSRLILQNRDDLASLQAAVAQQHDKVRIIKGSGVDSERFCAAGIAQSELSPSTPRTPLVILPARLLREKGVSEFIAASRLLRQQGIGARFVLVGSTDKVHHDTLLAQEVAAAEKEQLVECWGKRNDMPAVFNAADIVCLPSYREGLPKALLEAAACERAIITTDTPGCREIVHHQDNGLLVPARDAQALAQAVAELLSDEQKRTRMGKRGRERVVNEFCERIIDQETAAIWQETLDDTGLIPTICH